MTTLSLAFSMHHGLSLHGSQGNEDGSRTYVEILRKIGLLRDTIHMDGRTKPKERARIMLDIISMMKSWCDLNHLGVRSIEEEFHNRFKEYLHGHPIEEDKVPKMVTSLPTNLRILPLYAPGHGRLNDNHLTVFKKAADTGNEFGEYTYRLLYIDTTGKVVCFTAKQLVKGHMIEHEHEVAITHATVEELAECLGKNHLMFDFCMRELIRLCSAAVTRAMERADAANKTMNALITITEEMRRDDLTALILLSEEKPRGMSGCEMNKDIFRKIVEAAGSTPEARFEELERQCVILKRKDIANLSGLNIADTMQIIREWKIEKKEVVAA